MITQFHPTRLISGIIRSLSLKVLVLLSLIPMTGLSCQELSGRGLDTPPLPLSSRSATSEGKVSVPGRPAANTLFSAQHFPVLEGMAVSLASVDDTESFDYDMLFSVKRYKNKSSDQDCKEKRKSSKNKIIPKLNS